MTEADPRSRVLALANGAGGVRNLKFAAGVGRRCSDDATSHSGPDRANFDPAAGQHGVPGG